MYQKLSLFYWFVHLHKRLLTASWGAFEFLGMSLATSFDAFRYHMSLASLVHFWVFLGCLWVALVCSWVSFYHLMIRVCVCVLVTLVMFHAQLVRVFLARCNIRFYAWWFKSKSNSVFKHIKSICLWGKDTWQSESQAWRDYTMKL